MKNGEDVLEGSIDVGYGNVSQQAAVVWGVIDRGGRGLIHPLNP